MFFFGDAGRTYCNPCLMKCSLVVSVFFSFAFLDPRDQGDSSIEDAITQACVSVEAKLSGGAATEADLLAMIDAFAPQAWIFRIVPGANDLYSAFGGIKRVCPFSRLKGRPRPHFEDEYWIDRLASVPAIDPSAGHPALFLFSHPEARKEQLSRGRHLSRECDLFIFFAQALLSCVSVAVLVQHKPTESEARMLLTAHGIARDYEPGAVAPFAFLAFFIEKLNPSS